MPSTIQISLATNEMVVTLSNGDTMVHPASAFTGAALLRKPRFVYGVTDYNGSQLPQTPPIDYYVRCRFTDQRFFDIACGYVSNQPTWVNTQAGANLCVTAITTALAAAST